jgi:predicted secreted protein
VITIDQNYSGQTIDLPVGQVIELRLTENPTTGYSWTFLADGTPACLIVANRFERSAGPPGQGGEHTWQIKGALVGECEIVMQYRRSFQPAAPARSFSVRVRVIR